MRSRARRRELVIPVPAAAGRLSGRDVTLGVRPHHFELDPAGTISATVKDVQPTGVETILLCQLAGNEVLVQRMERVGVVAGQDIRLSVDERHVHLFAAEDGQRITL